MLQDAEQSARRHTLDLDVLVAGKDVDRQINQLKTAIAAHGPARPDLILVSPVREQLLLTLLRSAARAGIHWAFLTRWLDDIPALRREFPDVDIYSVSADQLEIGRLQGRQLEILREPEDEIIYLSGPAGTSSARQRTEGIAPELERARGKCQRFYGDWSQASGRIAAQRWLAGFPTSQRPSFLIVGQNDNMAIGAREAAEARLDLASKAGDLRVIGCDGSFSFGQRLVSQGKLSATIAVPPVSGRAIDAFAQRLAGRGRPNAIEHVAVASHPSLEALRAKHARLRF
jgi:ABC-type sugar transport system substrate-binding protein